MWERMTPLVLKSGYRLFENLKASPLVSGAPDVVFPKSELREANKLGALLRANHYADLDARSTCCYGAFNK